MEDLQNLLEKINRDGVEKADAEAKKIVEAARAKADSIIKDANAAAEKARSDAEKDSATYAERASETIRQAARDIEISVRGAVSALLESLLAKDVDKALGDEKTAVGIVAEAIKDLTGPGEIRCGAQLASALKSQAASLKSFTVSVDDASGSGFTVRTDGGRVEHDFTGATVSAELARHLRPDLAKLVLGA